MNPIAQPFIAIQQYKAFQSSSCTLTPNVNKRSMQNKSQFLTLTRAEHPLELPAVYPRHSFEPTRKMIKGKVGLPSLGETQ